jgi:hypothetical protein
MLAMLTKESVQSFRKEATWSKYLLMISFIVGLVFCGLLVDMDGKTRIEVSHREIVPVDRITLRDRPGIGFLRSVLVFVASGFC